MKTKPKNKKIKPGSISSKWLDIFFMLPQYAHDVNKNKKTKPISIKSIKEVIGTVKGNAHGLSWIGLFKTKDNKFLFIKSFDKPFEATKDSYVAAKLPTLINEVFKKPDKSRLFNFINKYLS